MSVEQQSTSLTIAKNFCELYCGRYTRKTGCELYYARRRHQIIDEGFCDKAKDRVSKRLGRITQDGFQLF